MSKGWGKKKDKKFEDLIDQIRRSKKYKLWKMAVLLKVFPANMKVPKGIQVHHKIEVSTILKREGIVSLKQAMGPSLLWDVSNGVVLKRGEHFILTRLRHYKYLSSGFHEFLQEWLQTCKIGQLERQK